MADTITLIPRDEEGSRIVERFAEATGLEAEAEGDAQVFEVEGTEHEIPIVQTLDDIDPDWPEHVELGEPA
jgi:hypothetical protein